MKKDVVAILGAGRIARVHVEMLVRYQRNVRIKYIVDPYLSEESEQWEIGRASCRERVCQYV